VARGIDKETEPLKSRFLVTLVLLAGFGAVTAAAQRTPRPDLYVIGIGSPRPELVDNVAAEIQARLRLSVGLLPPLELDPRAYDARRSQVIGERLIDAIKYRNPALTADARARVIGVTAFDMYMDARRAEWKFAFAVRSPDRRIAVISHARMDPVALGGASNDDLLRARLRKMVLKNVGIIYYGLRASNDPRSVMFNNVLGVDDLDRMTEEFDPK
jgi:predicted Zn-dependent protease